jgi:hypothetical protein
MNETVISSWQTPTAVAGRDAEAEARRVELARQVHAAAIRYRWSKAEVARRIEMAEGTFSQWYSGSYAGRVDLQNRKVAAWLAGVDEMEQAASGIPQSPPFQATAFAQELTEMLRLAQLMPTMVLVSAEAGLGKTLTAQRYAAAGQNVVLATMSPQTRSVYGMMHELAAALDIGATSNARLARAIGERLKRRGAGTLLIVDEVQNLADDAINQLRHFVDNYGCGIALVGNSEVYNRYARWAAGGGTGQLRSRIFKRLRRVNPSAADIGLFVAAWGIADREQVKFLTGVGMKPGALRQIDMTIKLAKIQAIGAGRELALDDLKNAWANRDVEGRA